MKSDRFNTQSFRYMIVTSYSYCNMAHTLAKEIDYPDSHIVPMLSPTTQNFEENHM